MRAAGGLDDTLPDTVLEISRQAAAEHAARRPRALSAATGCAAGRVVGAAVDGFGGKVEVGYGRADGVAAAGPAVRGPGWEAAVMVLSVTRSWRVSGPAARVRSGSHPRRREASQ